MGTIKHMLVLFAAGQAGVARTEPHPGGYVVTVSEGKWYFEVKPNRPARMFHPHSHPLDTGHLVRCAMVVGTVGGGGGDTKRSFL